MSKDGPVCEERPVEYRDYAQRQLAYYIAEGGIYEPLLVKQGEIMNIVFRDAKGGICRNLLRGLDNLREGTAKALDFYIDKVLNGEPLM